MVGIGLVGNVVIVIIVVGVVKFIKDKILFCNGGLKCLFDDE